MEISRLDLADQAAFRGCVETWQAAEAADDPADAPSSARMLSYRFRYSFGKDPVETWFLSGPRPGAAVGLYRLVLPDLENLDRARLDIVVHPAHRRRGAGRRLLSHAAARAAALGRTVLDGAVRDGSPGDAFAVSAGAKSGIGEAMRDLDLRAHPASSFTDLRAAAERSAAGYSLISWTGSVPEQYLGQVASVVNAFADAPRDEGVEVDLWDAERIRERGSATHEIIGTRTYTVVAAHDATGQLAALTEAAVDPDTPQWGHQGLTAVSREHRGHRLGLLLKIAMLDWLAEAEPQVERIETGNASDNGHMIAINEALGFSLRSPELHSCELAVADVLDPNQAAGSEPQAE